MSGHEPGADGPEPGHQVGHGEGRGQPVVFAEGTGQEPEGGGVTGLVVPDAGEGSSFHRAGGHFGQAPVRQFGAGLEGGVEPAVVPEGLIAQLAAQDRGDLPRGRGHGHQQPGGARPERGRAGVTVVGGGRRPARQRSLYLAPVHHGRRPQPAGP